MKKDFLSILDLTPDDLERCLETAARLKLERSLGRRAPTAHRLAGQHVAMLFDKPSLRTRATFEIAVRELGGEVIEPPPDSAFGARELPADVARNLERWVTAVVIRTFAQQSLVDFAAATTRLHVINALSDQEHPCQALADMLTLRERWTTLRGRVLTFVGDGNNVATSLAHAAGMLGIELRIASPSGFGLAQATLEQVARIAQHGVSIRTYSDPAAAVAGADAVYTDTWISMGQEADATRRRERFHAFQVNAALMARAKPGALFMHCLPAHRGEEVTDEVIDGACSVVFDQAENRLHTEKALLLRLLDES